MSKDPIRFDGHQGNLYVYSGDDPINRGDATGLDPTYNQCVQMATDEYARCTEHCHTVFAFMCMELGLEDTATCEAPCQPEFAYEVSTCRLTGGPLPPWAPALPPSTPVPGSYPFSPQGPIASVGA